MSRQFENLNGRKFGKLTVICRYSSNLYYCVCVCDCNLEIRVTVKADYLKAGRTKSCGCYRKEYRFDDLIGQKFHRLTVNKHIGINNEARIWECLCDCGNITNVDSYSLKHGRTKSCGCYLKDSAKIHSGKNSPSWKHSKTDEERFIERSYSEYAEWRKAVYERDGYTCRVCSSKKTAIAHHLENYADNPELRLDVNNGITLCKDCHIQFHRECGKHHNTKMQFLHWVENKGLPIFGNQITRPPTGFCRKSCK